MKIAVCFIYVLLSIAYLSITTEYVRIAGGINIITQLSFISYLCHHLQLSKVITDSERLFLQYIKYLGLGNCVYVIICLIKGGYWSINNIDAFAFVLSAGLLAFLIHIALKTNDNSR